MLAYAETCRERYFAKFAFTGKTWIVRLYYAAESVNLCIYCV